MSDDSILSGIEIEVDEPITCSKRTQIPISYIADTFAQNVDSLLGMISLPYAMLRFGQVSIRKVYRAILAALRKTNFTVNQWALSDEAEEKVSEEIAEFVANEPPDKLITPDFAEKDLQLLLGIKEINRATRALLFGGLAYMWASFECALKEAWVAALNARPKSLAYPAITMSPNETEVSGLSAKSISVGLLSKYSFDVKSKLGTLLAPKYDFTSVRGICRAYSAVFCKEDMEKLLDDILLRELEATRHLIVHRSGIIDSEYNERTGQNLPEGRLLELSGSKVSELSNRGIKAVLDLLYYVDNWLSKHPD